MNAAGAASMSRVNSGANSPNTDGEQPAADARGVLPRRVRRTRRAARWSGRSGRWTPRRPRRPAATRRPQATVIALTGGSWPRGAQHGDALPVLHHQHRDGERHHQLDHGLRSTTPGPASTGRGQPLRRSPVRGRTARSARRRPPPTSSAHDDRRQPSGRGQHRQQQERQHHRAGDRRGRRAGRAPGRCRSAGTPRRPCPSRSASAPRPWPGAPSRTARAPASAARWRRRRRPPRASSGGRAPGRPARCPGSSRRTPAAAGTASRPAP